MPSWGLLIRWFGITGLGKTLGPVCKTEQLNPIMTCHTEYSVRSRLSHNESDTVSSPETLVIERNDWTQSTKEWVPAMDFPAILRISTSCSPATEYCSLTLFRIIIVVCDASGCLMI